MSRREYHATFKAVATHTDQGLFTAVISSEAADRERDVVLASAMAEALRAWESTHKAIPLAWNHSSAAEDIVGHIDPSSVEELDGEVVASGWVDQDTPRGAETWRLMKSGTLGFSFGYLVTRSTGRGEGTRVIEALDVFELSATATPMNNRTRVLSTKSTASRVPTDAELRAQAKRLGIEMPLSDRETEAQVRRARPRCRPRRGEATEARAAEAGRRASAQGSTPALRQTGTRARPR